MRKKNEEDFPVGRLVVVEDDLPGPEELWTPEDSVKVTLKLTRRSIQFFKNVARKRRAKYQRLIRDLVDRYSTLHAKKAA